jgi:rod shape-determining protein MreC
MPLGTLDRTAPPLFNQGPSALSKLIFFSTLALFLMVADARFHIVQPVRQAIAAVLYPVQWVALKPVQFVVGAGGYLEDLQTAQKNEADARKALMLQAERASQADTLAQDNARLRALLELRQLQQTPGRAAEVLYDAADPYTRKIVIDQGLAQGVAPGSPVIDAQGVLGQVTAVQPFTSEVTLVIDRDLSIPVQNTRTGVRSVAFGDASAHGGGLELRFMAANADLQEGDLLSTSGVDGIYPAGLPVAKIERIERRADSAFARIYCVPLAHVMAARYVLVLQPTGAPSAPPPATAAAPAPRPKKAEGKAGAAVKGAEKASEKNGAAAAAKKPAEAAR